MIVNTASKCGFTPQFDGLETLYRKYKDRGFAVMLGFPSKDFGNQEYGTEQEPLDFCRLTYGVQFPMYATTNAKKGKANPLFKGLKPKPRTAIIRHGISTNISSTEMAT